LFPLSGIVIFLIPLILNKGQADGSFEELFSVKNSVKGAQVEPARETPAKAVEMEAE